MTTTLATPAATARIAQHLRGEDVLDAQSSCGEQPQSNVTFVLAISGMPVHLRGHVEQLMADHLPPSEPDIAPGTDIWDVQWFTRWQRDTTTFGARGLRCREVLTAPAEATEKFGLSLGTLAREYGFQASV